MIRVTTKFSNTKPINNQDKSKINLAKLILHHRSSWYRNGPDLVQARQMKWWVKSRFYSALNLNLPLRRDHTSGD